MHTLFTPTPAAAPAIDPAQMVHHHLFWLKSRGYDVNNQLHGEFSRQLTDHITSALQPGSGENRHGWVQQTTALFEHNKYAVRFSLHYALHPVTRDLQVRQVSASLLDCKTNVPVPSAQVRDLPLAHTVFRSLRDANVARSQTIWNRQRYTNTHSVNWRKTL